MEKITIEMPPISKCQVLNCAYNVKASCHARAITVGDAGPVTVAGCDTFFSSEYHIKETKRIAGVGACKMTQCSFNQDFECMANSVQIGVQENHVQCLTFQIRSAAV